jgi:peptidoglycan/LPS O-acetylase OafA/YrhL
LRAISVLAVMAFHHYFIFGSERGWMPGGFMGVEVFFVVSGYLITSLLLAERRDKGGVSFKNFWVRRARRLLPALWLLLAAVCAYSLLFLPNSIDILKGDVFAALVYVSNWWQIVSHRSYGDVLQPELLKHLWSLAIEEQFYLFWPVILIFGLKRLGRQTMILGMLATAAVSTILLAAISLTSLTFAYYSTFTRLSGLLLGGVMAFYYATYKIRRIPGRGARLALDIAGAAGLLFLIWSFTTYTFPATDSGPVDRSVFFGGFLFVDFATLLVIAAAVHPASDVGRILGWRPLQWIGLRSYGLYLWHYPIFCVTRPRVDFTHFGHLHGWPVLVIRLGLTFGAAELSYKFIETPIRHGAIGRYRERLKESHGSIHRRLLSRGIVTIGALSLIVVVLFAGLASADPKKEFTGPANGGSADSSALSALLNNASSTTTTTTVPPTPTTTGKNGVTTPTTKPTVAPPTTAKPGPTGSLVSLGIGDSVMLGARGALKRTIPSMVVDAKVSRQFGEAIAVLNTYRSQHLLPPTIVMHLGTNGRITPSLFAQAMNTIGPGHQVYFLTPRVPRSWEAEDYQTIQQGVQKFKAAHMLDWHAFSTCHDDWFVNDGFHLRDEGQRQYANFVLAGIQGKPIKRTCK